VVLAALSENLQQQITGSPEWKARTSRSAKTATGQQPPAEQGGDSGFGNMQDDIPW
jgi:hypothetical protein